MSVGIIIATVMFCFYLYQYIEEKKQQKAEDNQFFNELMNSVNHQEDDVKVEKCLDERTNTGLVYSSLRKIGCEYETEIVDNITWISFEYQGAKFLISCCDGSKVATAYYPWWYALSIYSDLEDIANLQKAINKANQFGCCTLFYETNNQSEQIGVYSKSMMLFIPEIPKIDIYLKSVLEDFFKVERFVLTELEKCNVAENK